jgi:hypothetical protein
MSKLRNMRGIEIPTFRAVSTGERTLDELCHRRHTQTVRLLRIPDCKRDYLTKLSLKKMTVYDKLEHVP